MITTTDAIEVKGSSLRGLLLALDAAGMREVVTADAPADVRAVLAAPPPATAWMPNRAFECVALAVEARAGRRRWRELMHTASLEGVIPLLRAALEGFLRLFGARPDTLFTRWHQVASTMVRGIRHAYRPLGPRRGEMEVTLKGCVGVPPVVFHGSAGAFEVAFDLTRTRGTVEDPVIVADGVGNRAVYHFSW
jgi:hypothetical protein